MNQVKRNILANYAGSFWAALMPLAFTPLYIGFMGIESFGLVGFFASLEAMLGLLDMGLRTTFNREMARLSSVDGAERVAVDLLRTLEVIYWSVGVAIGLGVVLLSFPVARYWINPGRLSVHDVQQAVMLMGLIMALRWPCALYSGGLMGLQKQVLLNSVSATSATIRGAGAVLVLWLVSPTIQAFFSWHIVASALETFFVACCLRWSLPSSSARPRFRKKLLVEIWRFAAGITAINILSPILSQMDKIILSNMLTLQMFGYYTLAWTVAGGIRRLSSPIPEAVFPRLVQMVTQGRTRELSDFYHSSCQLMSLIVLPAATVLAVFSYQVVAIWMNDSMVAEETHLVCSILAIGAACSGIVHLPVALQFACGRTSLLIWTNVVCLALMIPMLMWSVPRFGMVGGALTWTILNVGTFLIIAQVMHNSILKGEQWQYYLIDVGLPWLGAAAATLIGRLLLPSHAPVISDLLFLTAIAGAALAAAAIAAPRARLRLALLFSREA